MPTGACGVNCDVCRLKILGICSSCGPGTSLEAAKKIEAQKRLLGHPCPILACAQMNNIRFCLRDCKMFPCENFETGPYPFSEAYLNMQKRRRKQPPPLRTPAGEVIQVPSGYWDELKKMNLRELCERSLAVPHPPEGVIVRYLNYDVLVDMVNRCLLRLYPGQKEKLDNILLELVVLVYLRNVTSDLIMREMVSVSDLKDAQFFQGPHALKTAPVLERFGRDLEGFRRAAENLGGEHLDLADAAYKFSPLPKIPLYYLFWEGDEEFQPHLSILFDRSIERHLSADAIWGLVILVSNELINI